MVATLTVLGFAPTVTAPDGSLTGLPLAIGTATSGTFSSTAKTAKLKFTSVLTCGNPGCAVGGPTTFNISLSIGPGSTYTFHTESNGSATTACEVLETTLEGNLVLAKAKGSVKVGGKSTAIHRWVKDASSHMTSTLTTTKIVSKPVCS